MATRLENKIVREIGADQLSGLLGITVSRNMVITIDPRGVSFKGKGKHAEGEFVPWDKIIDLAAGGRGISHFEHELKK